MPKIKTSDLIDLALDWAVANCQWPQGVRYIESLEKFSMPDESPYCFLPEYTPSTDWAQGGPIIERELITLAWGDEGGEPDWFSCVGDSRRFDCDTPDGIEKLVGPTPLVAAMRCYVASKLGDTVDVPDELA